MNFFIIYLANAVICERSIGIKGISFKLLRKTKPQISKNVK